MGPNRLYTSIVALWCRILCIFLLPFASLVRRSGDVNTAVSDLIGNSWPPLINDLSLHFLTSTSIPSLYGHAFTIEGRPSRAIVRTSLTLSLRYGDWRLLPLSPTCSDPSPDIDGVIPRITSPAPHHHTSWRLNSLPGVDGNNESGSGSGRKDASDSVDGGLTDLERYRAR